jgi:uncharacterized protein YqeY
MSLVEQVQKDLVTSMKRKDSIRTSVLRMIKTALRNREIEKRNELTEADAVQVLKTMVKQLSEAIEHFESAGRLDLVEKERQEKAVVESYLPEPISAEEIEKIVGNAVQEVRASGPKDMGAVMREAVARLQATGKTVDGKTVSARVRSHLQALAKPDSH